MNTLDIGNLIYLVLLGCVILFWFIVQNRNSLGKTLQQAVLWGLIFFGVIATFGMWDSIRQTILPQQSVMAEQGTIKLPRAPDGHYYVTAELNGAPTRFVVDTGASEVVLSQEDAKRAGLDPANLIYTGRAMSANGPVATAPVRLDEFAIGPIVDERLPVWVNQGEMNTSLLGMSYLNLYSSIEIKDDALILTR